MSRDIERACNLARPKYGSRCCCCCWPVQLMMTRCDLPCCGLGPHRMLYEERIKRLLYVVASIVFTSPLACTAFETIFLQQLVYFWPAGVAWKYKFDDNYPRWLVGWLAGCSSTNFNSKITMTFCKVLHAIWTNRSFRPITICPEETLHADKDVVAHHRASFSLRGLALDTFLKNHPTDEFSFVDVVPSGKSLIVRKKN